MHHTYISSGTKAKKMFNILLFMAGMSALIAYMVALKKKRQEEVAFFPWIDSMREEVRKKVSHAAELSQEFYNRIIDEVIEQYQKIRQSNDEQIQRAGEMLKSEWDQIRGK